MKLTEIGYVIKAKDAKEYLRYEEEYDWFTVPNIFNAEFFSDYNEAIKLINNYSEFFGELKILKIERNIIIVEEDCNE